MRSRIATVVCRLSYWAGGGAAYRLVLERRQAGDWKEEARKEKKLIDVTEGRRTRAIVILDTGHLVLSSVQPETISHRFAVMSEDMKNPTHVLTRDPEEESGE